MLFHTSLTEERRDKGHWIGIHSDHWREMFHGDASKVLKAGQDCGLIERNGKYSVGRFPKSYRLASEYRTGAHVPYELAMPPKSKIGRPGLVAGKNLKEAGEKLLARMPWVELGNVRKMDLPRSERGRHWVELQIGTVKAGHLRAMRCEYGRLHTSYTPLPKAVRRHLVGRDGQKLSSVDVSNCQPLILGILASRSIQPAADAPRYHMLHAGGLGDYLGRCEEGQLYEFLVERMHAGDGGTEVRQVDFVKNGMHMTIEVDPAKADRDTVKKEFMVCLFSDVERMRSMPIYRIVERFWPALADYLVATKSTEGYASVAEACQRMESDLMIEGVAMEFMRRHPNAPIFTVHDEINCPVDLAGEVKELIEAAFRRKGVAAKTKVAA
jgi:hypothetical protein